MRFPLPILCAALAPLFLGCGKKDSSDKAVAPSWTPILGTCTTEENKPCFLSDQTSGLIWSAHESMLPQKQAEAYCRSINMRLPTFREYAVAAKNGMLDVPHFFPAFGEVEAILWTAEPQTYIVFADNTATKRQGEAPALFKCVTGEGVPSTSPRTASEPVLNDTTARTPQRNSCQEYRDLECVGGTKHIFAFSLNTKFDHQLMIIDHAGFSTTSRGRAKLVLMNYLGGGQKVAFDTPSRDSVAKTKKFYPTMQCRRV